MPKFNNKPVDVVIDVRTRLEFWFGHLDGSKNIPVTRIETGIASESDVPKDARILVYCASGGRSAMAARKLRELGYTCVTDGGGITTARQGFKP